VPSGHRLRDHLRHTQQRVGIGVEEELDLELDAEDLEDLANLQFDIISFDEPRIFESILVFKCWF
jgi:hypothetical protein